MSLPIDATTLAFDRLAPHYDALADGELFRLMRRRTHAAFARAFRAGARVLEIGCGTGLDTAFLAGRGVCVVACDPSEAMVGRTLTRLEHEGVSDRATVMPCGLQNVMMFLDGLGERGSFDGIISNFGALNCVARLDPLVSVAARALEPRGVVFLGLIGRHCAIEAIYFAVTGRRQLIGRRSADGPVAVPVAGVEVPTYYHRTRDVVAALQPELSFAGVTGVGVAIPPPYFERRWQTIPGVVRSMLTGIDAVVGAWPPFNRLGDHVLLKFVKRSACPERGRRTDA